MKGERKESGGTNNSHSAWIIRNEHVILWPLFRPLRWIQGQKDGERAHCSGYSTLASHHSIFAGQVVSRTDIRFRKESREVNSQLISLPISAHKNLLRAERWEEPWKSNMGREEKNED